MFTKKLPIAICFFILSLNSFAEPYYIMVTNGSLNEINKYQFDVVIKSISGNLELTSYQVSLKYNINRNQLSFSYINGTSELNNIPEVGIGVLGYDDSVLTFASLPGADIITENEVKIGRFEISSNESLEGEDLNLYWNFNGEVETILTGTGFNNITNPSNHFPGNQNYHPINKPAMNYENVSEELLPENFELLQNYPNPFNPSTTIKYKVPSDSFIQVKLFNILGEEVRRLVDEFVSPGIYELKLNAESLPSGYYLYSLYADNKVIDNKKMILIK